MKETLNTPFNFSFLEFDAYYDLYNKILDQSKHKPENESSHYESVGNFQELVIDIFNQNLGSDGYDKEWTVMYNQGESKYSSGSIEPDHISTKLLSDLQSRIQQSWDEWLFHFTIEDIGTPTLLDEIFYYKECFYISISDKSKLEEIKTEIQQRLKELT